MTKKISDDMKEMDSDMDMEDDEDEGSPSQSPFPTKSTKFGFSEKTAEGGISKLFLNALGQASEKDPKATFGVIQQLLSIVGGAAPSPMGETPPPPGPMAAMMMGGPSPGSGPPPGMPPPPGGIPPMKPPGM